MARRPASEVNGLVEAARELIHSGEASNLAQAAASVGLDPRTLKNHLGDAAPAPDERDPLNADVDPGEIPVIHRDYSHLETLHVFPLGDVHKGSPNYQRSKWLEWIAYLTNTPNTSLLGTGDFFNSALRNSVSDVYEEEGTLPLHKRELALELEPIRDRVDVLVKGNHENRVTKLTGDCPLSDVAWKLEVPYASSAVCVVYQVGEVEYTVYLRHGTGSGRAGAQAARMEREALVIVADVYVNGHTHRQQVLRGAIFEVHDREVQRRRQLYVTSGSFLSYEDYAASAGLPPADIGAPRIRLDGTRKDAHVSI